MAASGSTITTIDNTLREDYAPAIEELLKTSNELAGIIKQKVAQKSKFGGKNFRMNIPLEINRNWAVAHYAEGDNLPDPDHLGYDNSTPTLASLDGAIQLSGHSLDASENDRAYVQSMSQEIKRMVETMKLRIGIAYHGDGSGKIGKVNGTVTASTSVILDTYPIQWLDKNMRVDFYLNGSGNVDGVYTDQMISSIAQTGPAVGTLTMESAVTLVDNDDIYLTGEYGKTIIMGLLGIVDDGNGTATLQGIASRTTKPYWQAQLVSASSRAFSEDEVQAAIDETELKGLGDPEIDVLLTDHLTRRYINQATLYDKQQIVDSRDAVGGANGTFWIVGGRKLKVIVDRFAYPGYLYGLDSSKLLCGWAPKVGGQWMDRGNGILKQIQFQDEWRADYYCRHGLFTKNPTTSFRLYSYAAA